MRTYLYVPARINIIFLSLFTFVCTSVFLKMNMPRIPSHYESMFSLLWYLFYACAIFR